jgi:hypothetical protein
LKSTSRSGNAQLMADSWAYISRVFLDLVSSNLNLWLQVICVQLQECLNNVSQFK